jgi:antirestriction protein ArdC
MANSKTKTAEEIRKEVTNRIIQAIEAGTPPWRQPWSEGMFGMGLPCNFHSKRRYTGINPLILLWWSIAFNYQSRYWGTANSWLANFGVHVKKGERAAYVTLFRMIPKKINGIIQKDTQGKDKVIPIMREYPVFNAQQMTAPSVEILLDGRGTYGIVKALLGQHDKKNRKNVTTKSELLQIAEKYLPANKRPTKADSRESIARQIHEGIDAKLADYLVSSVAESPIPNFAPADELIKATGAKIQHGADKAYYKHKSDQICVPNRNRFVSTATYYETVFHELVHWTEKEGRVGRKEGHNYAFGELVAEIGASFICMELGVPLAETMLENSQSYVAGWLKRMGEDTKFIFEAATQASKAVDYILSFIGKQNPAYNSNNEHEESNNTEVLEFAA